MVKASRDYEKEAEGKDWLTLDSELDQVESMLSVINKNAISTALMGR